MNTNLHAEETGRSFKWLPHKYLWLMYRVQHKDIRIYPSKVEYLRSQNSYSVSEIEIKNTFLLKNNLHVSYHVSCMYLSSNVSMTPSCSFNCSQECRKTSKLFMVVYDFARSANVSYGSNSTSQIPHFFLFTQPLSAE